MAIWEFEQLNQNVIEVWRMFLTWYNFFFATSTVMLGWIVTGTEFRTAPHFTAFVTMMAIITLIGVVGPAFLFRFVVSSKRRLAVLTKQIGEESGHKPLLPILLNYAPTVSLLYGLSFLVMLSLWLLIGFAV